MNKTLGAYYQAYKRPNCVDFVLTTFRKQYPNAPIHLVSDGGDDFSELAKQYNCHYFYEENLTCFHGKIDGIRYNYPQKWNNNSEEKRETLKKYVTRIGNHIKQMKTDYFMLLEDDVYIINKTNLDQLKFQINGNNPHHSYPIEVCKYLANTEFLSYGGCGGCIFDLNFFNQVINENKNLKKEIDIYCDLTKHYVDNGNQNWWGSDAILSFLCYFHKGTIGEYRGFCEVWHSNFKERLLNNTIEVLHQYKKNY
jgi:hypothetical protein